MAGAAEHAKKKHAKKKPDERVSERGPRRALPVGHLIWAAPARAFFAHYHEGHLPQALLVVS